MEYQLRGVNQIQVNAKIGLSFASGLRAIVRQDPDSHPGRRDPGSGDRRDCRPVGPDRAPPVQHPSHQRFRRRHYPPSGYEGREFFIEFNPPGDSGPASCPDHLHRLQKADPARGEIAAGHGAPRRNPVPGNLFFRRGVRGMPEYRVQGKEGHLRIPAGGRDIRKEIVANAAPKESRRSPPGKG